MEESKHLRRTERRASNLKNVYNKENQKATMQKLRLEWKQQLREQNTTMLSENKAQTPVSK